MKVLSLGLDNSILDKNSALAARVVEYGNLVDKYIIIVPDDEKKNIELSPQVAVYGAAKSCKFFKFINIYKLAHGLLIQTKYEVITVQDPYFIGLIGWLLAKKFKIGLEVQIHGWERFGILRSTIVNIVLQRAGSIRVVSQRLKKDLINKFGINEEKIIVVPIFSYIKKNEADLVNIKKLNKFIFLTVGRLAPVKNIKLQLEALASVIKEKPIVELQIVGEGPERNNLEVVARKLKIEKNIKFLGQKNRTELEQIYRNADCFLLTSNSEGWGLAVIEAIGYRLPVIMTDVGCAGEIIKNEESGLVVPVGDRTAAVRAMKRLITDENLRILLAKKATVALQALPTKEETLNLYKKSWELASKNKNI